MRISRVCKILRKCFGNESGLALIEILVALAILGAVAVTFLSGLATASRAVIITDEQAIAESLAYSQLEYTKKLVYQYDASEYPLDPTLDIPESWSVLVPVVEPVHASDDGIQKVTVTVERNGEAVFVLEGYKVSR